VQVTKRTQSALFPTTIIERKIAAAENQPGERSGRPHDKYHHTKFTEIHYDTQ
jgi:hypothetical protein